MLRTERLALGGGDDEGRSTGRSESAEMSKARVKAHEVR
jgi:hypothetical protein